MKKQFREKQQESAGFSPNSVFPGNSNFLNTFFSHSIYKVMRSVQTVVASHFKLITPFVRGSPRLSLAASPRYWHLYTLLSTNDILFPFLSICAHFPPPYWFIFNSISLALKSSQIPSCLHLWHDSQSHLLFFPKFHLLQATSLLNTYTYIYSQLCEYKPIDFPVHFNLVTCRSVLVAQDIISSIWRLADTTDIL